MLQLPTAPATASSVSAIGFVRVDLSAHNAPRHVHEICRYARESGYRYLYTVRPPVDDPNPLGYVGSLASELSAEVIIAFDLGQVDNRPALLCDLGYRLETVCPHSVWLPNTSLPPAGGAPV